MKIIKVPETHVRTVDFGNHLELNLHFDDMIKFNYLRKVNDAKYVHRITYYML